MLEHFKGSLVKALEHAFPNIGIDASGFDVMSSMILPRNSDRREEKR
jgi:hypothetical protein